MLRGLLFCAAACAAPTTVFAGDRDLPLVPDLRAFLTTDSPTSLAPSRRPVAPRLPAATFLPIAYHGVERAQIAATLTRPTQPPVRLHSSLLLSQLPVLPNWHLDGVDTGTDSTSARGGSWAVYDTLSQQRRPTIRRTALSTMLVLRIDGEADSPPISVGGGGLAAALWRAMPGN